MKRGMVLAWLRLFAVQASWSYDRMAAIGTSRAMEPMLRDLPGGPQGARYHDALRRSVSFFNSHPYLTGVAVGAMARAEHDGIPGEQIDRLRSALTSSLGSMGDRLIWAGVLPFASGIGLALSALTPRWWVGPLVFLVLYNVVHVAVRTWGLRAGWKSGAMVAKALTAPFFKVGLRVAGPAAALSVGFAVPMVSNWLSTGVSPMLRGEVLGVTAMGVMCSLWLTPRLGGLRYGLIAAFAAMGIGLIWR